jgi:hypothetical protein
MSSATFSDEITESERDLGYEVRDVIDPDGLGIVMAPTPVKAVVFNLIPSRRIIKLDGGGYRLEVYEQWNPGSSVKWIMFGDAVPSAKAAIENAKTLADQKPGQSFVEQDASAGS